MADRRPTGFRIGRRYRLRCGEIVTITERVSYSWRDAKGRRQELPIWVIEGEGLRASLMFDGAFSPSGPDRLDIVARVWA